MKAQSYHEKLRKWNDIKRQDRAQWGLSDDPLYIVYSHSKVSGIYFISLSASTIGNKCNLWLQSSRCVGKLVPWISITFRCVTFAMTANDSRPQKFREQISPSTSHITFPPNFSLFNVNPPGCLAASKDACLSVYHLVLIRLSGGNQFAVRSAYWAYWLPT